MTHHHNDSQRIRRAGAGFTVVEMMIVLTLLLILVSIVIVSMSRVRQSASRTETTNALRHLAGGYNAYMQDHRNRLMPGYLDESPDPDYDHYVQQFRINARREDGTRFIEDFADATEPYEDLASYVWRLAPYIDFDWHAMLVDYPSANTVSRLQGDLVSEDPVYGPSNYTPSSPPADQRVISMVPSIGLNSIFLGGDTRHGGEDITERHPWHPSVVNGTNEKIAATRFSEVRNPAQIVLFAPVGRADTNLSSDEPYIKPGWAGHAIGYPELRPPFLLRDSGTWVATHRQWRVGKQMEIDRLETGEYANGAGLPIMRWGGNVLPVAHLDGSAMIEDIELLSSDMRRWAPDETGTVSPEIELGGSPPGGP